MSEENTPHVSVEYDGSSVHYYSIEYGSHVDDSGVDTAESMPEESLVDELPAEISARHAQYAYYRDKLLTFREKVA